MSSILKATPRAILRGIQDLSRRSPVVESELLPQHLPHVYLLTERGPTLPQVAIGDGLVQLYGTSVLDLRSKYANHQTVLASRVMATGNFCMVQRLKPANAKTAMLRLSAELIPAEVTLYARNPDGSYQIGAGGLPIPITVPDGDGGTIISKVIGHRVVWHTSLTGYTGAGRNFGTGVTITDHRDGSVLAGGVKLSSLFSSGTTPVKSKLYPIMDFEVASFGEFGNRVGLRLSAPNADDAAVGDYATMNEIGSYLYRLGCVERPVNSATPLITETNGGEASIDVSLKDNVYHPVSGLPLSFNELFIDSYQSLDDPTVVPKFGPFGRAHIYKTQLNEVLTALCAGGTEQNNLTIGEGLYDTTAAAHGRAEAIQFTGRTDNYPLLNLFTGVDQNGVPYYTFNVSDSVLFGGVALGESNVHYATGGDDGLAVDVNGKPDTLANLRIYDELVGIELSQYGYGEAKLLDVAKYPHSTFWDSGFSFETKKKMLVPMSRRKDIWVVLATQAVADYANPTTPTPETWAYEEPNNVELENSIAVNLRTIAGNYPESEIYGTPVCRVSIVGHCGTLLNTNYRGGLLPLTIDMASKVARYMGAGTGSWANGFGFDESPNNIVTDFRNINHTWKSVDTYNKDWDAGLVWVQSFDRRSVFYPGIQTAYPDDTSVLNSLITVAACCFLEKVSQLVWRALSGTTRLTNGQFIERSNALIVSNTQDRFDGRFIIQPETFYTPADAQRGFSWGSKIHIYANNMKTVGTMTIVAHRLEDLVQ